MASPVPLEKLKALLNDDLDVNFPPNTPSLPPKVTDHQSLLDNDELESQFLKSLASIDLRLNDPQYYNSERAKLKEMKKNVGQTKSTLSDLVEYLTTFETNLSDLSSQMNSLKSQSELLNKQLTENSKFEEKLIPIVTDLIVSPEIIESVIRGKIERQWCDNLNYINLKIELYRKYEREDLESSQDLDGPLSKDQLTKLLEEMKSLIDMLIWKAVERIKDYLVSKIKLIRYSKNCALQVIQNNFLACKEIFSFLLIHNEPLAVDLRHAYVLTVRWYYYKSFGKYLYSLEKLKLFNIGSGYLLGNSEASPESQDLKPSKTWLTPFTASSSARASTTKPHVVSLMGYLQASERVETLTVEQTVIPAQIAETNPLTNWLETPFRCFNTAIVDNGTVEYIILNEFFQLHDPDQLSKTFQEIFKNVFSIGVAYSKTYLANTTNYDLFAILVCIKLCQSFLFKLQHQKIPVMENYFNLQMITLWPRYQTIIDAHCENLKKVLIKSSSYFSFSKDNMFKNDASLEPHGLTRQFAAMMVSLLDIAAVDAHPSYGQGAIEMGLKTEAAHKIRETEPLSTSIVRLRNEYENIVNKLSAVVVSGGKTGSQATEGSRETFLYNNYSFIYAAISRCEGSAAQEQKEHFQLLLDAYSK